MGFWICFQPSEPTASISMKYSKLNIRNTPPKLEELIERPQYPYNYGNYEEHQRGERETPQDLYIYQYRDSICLWSKASVIGHTPGPTRPGIAVKLPGTNGPKEVTVVLFTPQLTVQFTGNFALGQ